jgi:hypothetical protein
LREGGWFRQRNQTAKLNDGKFLFSFLFSCFGHPTISSLSHWTCVRPAQ